jgi:hypothetical protein
MFCRLKDLRRVGIQCDELASSFAAAAAMGVIIIWQM